MKNSIKTFVISSLMIVGSIFLISNSSSAQNNNSGKAQGKTVIEAVNSNKNTSEFASLLKKSGFSAVLKKEGPYTVLAPTNEAIDGVNDNLKAKPKNLMRGQLFQGEVPKKKVESQMNVKVLKTDKSPSNGIVYIVDKVSQPQEQSQQ